MPLCESIVASTGIPKFRDFTIRDPRYFVILFWASFHDFEEKNPKYFFSEFFFGFLKKSFIFFSLYTVQWLSSDEY